MACLGLAMGAGAVRAANSIAVPNDGPGPGPTCSNTNPNSARFAGNCGARVTFDGSTNDAFVQDNSSFGEQEYRVRFYVNLRGSTAPALGYEQFGAYTGAEPTPPAAPAAGTSRLRVFVTPAANGEENLFVAVREDGGGEVTSNGILLLHGWHSIELRWVRAQTPTSEDGLVELWVNGTKRVAEMAALQGLDNNSGGIDYERWGAAAMTNAPTGTIDMDSFASQRTGYIGPEAAFADVPTSHQFFKEIQGFYAGGITGGCGSNPLVFCPTNDAIRGAMAVFIMRAKALYVDHIPNYSPPAKQNIFADPEFDDANCASNNPLGCSLLSQEPWAEAMYNAGITQGCNTSPLMYCPANKLTRNGLAVFILRALEGQSYVPPPKQNIFQDPQYDDANCATNGNPAGCSMIPHEALVEEFYNRGITTGCSASPLLFCPSNNGLRQTIAVFMSRAMDIPFHEVGP